MLVDYCIPETWPGGLEMSVSSHMIWSVWQSNLFMESSISCLENILFFRLMFEVSSRHATAYVDHNNGTKVVEASTREYCIAKHLYKTSDVSAAYNIGRVIASRCKETGLYRVMWEHKMDRSHKKVRCYSSCSLSFLQSSSFSLPIYVLAGEGISERCSWRWLVAEWAQGEKDATKARTTS